MSVTMANQGIKERSRRDFLGDLSLAGTAVILGLKSESAAAEPPMADVPFVNFAFPALGAPTNINRTMPTRLSERVNVKDWGAVGNGSDETAAIQAAIDYCINTNKGGEVYFPACSDHYQVTSLAVGSNSIDCGVRLVGAGPAGTIVNGSGTYPISGGGRTYDCLESVEYMDVAGGTFGIKLTRQNSSVIGCQTTIDASSPNVHYIVGCGRASGNNPPWSVSPPPGPAVGSIGVAIGSGVVTGCKYAYFDVAYAISGRGVACFGNAAEDNNTGFRVGWGPAGETPAIGCAVTACQTERSATAIDMYNATSCYVASNVLTGTSGVPDPGMTLAATNGMTWSAGIVTVNCSRAHNLGANGTKRVLFFFINEMNAAGVGSWLPASNGLGLCTITSTTAFTYPLAAQPSAWNNTNIGIWTLPLLYGMRFRKVYSCYFGGADIGITAAKATFDLDYDGQADHLNNTAFGMTGGYGFMVPSATKNLAGWQFRNCATTGISLEPQTTTAKSVLTNPNNSMRVADLPGKSGVAQPVIETMEYSVIDSTVAALNNFGAEVVGTGGSGNNVKVRYNGSIWAISG